MNTKAGFTKKDIAVILGCVVFILCSLNAIGNRGRRKAKEIVCLSKQFKLGQACILFSEENDGYLITMPKRGSPGQPGTYFDDPCSNYEWAEIIRSKIDVRGGAALCPEATKLMIKGNGAINTTTRSWDTAWGIWFPSFVCSGGVCNRGAYDYGSIGYNEWAKRPADDCHNPVWDTSGWNKSKFWNSPNVREANSVPLFTGNMSTDAIPSHNEEPPPYHGADPWKMGDIMHSGLRRTCLDRHSGYVNGVFMDLSARPIGLKELWEIHWHRGWFDGPSGNIPPAEFNDPTHWMYKYPNYPLEEPPPDNGGGGGGGGDK